MFGATWHQSMSTYTFTVSLPVRGAPWWVLLQHSIIWRFIISVLSYFSSSSVVSPAFSALCVYSKFEHHRHSLGYLCAKFRFFRSLHCWASPWRKIAYSTTRHSVTLLIIWCAGNRSSCASGGTSMFAAWSKRPCCCRRQSDQFCNHGRTSGMWTNFWDPSQSSRIRILRFFSDFKKHDFLPFFWKWRIKKS